MLKITYGTPEIHVPSKYCPDFRYTETEVRYPTDQIGFRCSERGCVLTFPMEKDTQIYGLGLQHKQFNHLGRQMRLHVRADPRVPNGDSHAPVPFFVTNKGYGIYIDTARYAEFTFGCQPNPAFGGVRPARVWLRKQAAPGCPPFPRKISMLSARPQIS